MVVRKILEATLVAGSTSVTFTDTDIPNSLLRVYCTKASLFPLSQTLSGNVLSVNYKAQTENVGVALEIVKSGLDIIDDLESDDATKALSANQGYVLKGLIDGIVIPTVPENITDLDDVSVSDIQSGQVLAWNSTSEKFENVDQSGGGSSSNDFPADSTPIIIGKYGTRDIYRKRIYVANLTTGGNSISSQLPNFDILIDWHGYFKTAGTSPRYMPINSDINSANWWCGVLTYGTYVPPTGDIWAGAQFAGGSAEVWIDYVPPVS